MAAKKETATLRGSKLIKKAIESAKATGLIAEPEPMPAGLARKMKLPNGESLSPAMKELFLFDCSWLGVEYDEDEAEIEGMALEEVVEEHFGEPAVAGFAEAIEMLADDCVFFGAELEPAACLYTGTPDDAGEYPVLLMKWEEGVARFGGFIPFDVWAAQQLGAIERGNGFGDVPEAYAALPTALATANGDGRVTFTPTAGEPGEGKSDDDEEEDDDEDEEKESDGEDEDDAQ